MKRVNSTEPYLVTYLHQKGRKLGLPVAGNFELTSRCNFNCPMCYVHMTQEQVDAMGGELTAAEWLSIAEAAKNKGMVFALLTGGEPLMRKDFFEIYRGMKDMGLMISINSNGSMLKGSILETFLKDPPIRFNISLYGGCDETYAKMCGLPMYRQVKDNIRALRQAGIEVSLNLSITPYNRQDLQLIYEDACELNLNVRASSYMYPPVRINDGHYGCGNRLTATESARCAVEWDILRFTQEEFNQRAENMHRMVAEFPDGCPVETSEGVRCRAGSSSFWITWDGKMMPCGMLTTPVAYPLVDGFDKAWEQIRMETAKIKMPSECGSCAHRDFCGVCAAVCFTETGRFDKVPNYICERAEEQIRITHEVYLERNKL